MKPQTIVFLEPAASVLQMIHCAKRMGYATVALSCAPERLRKTRHPYGIFYSSIDAVVQVASWDASEELFAQIDLIERTNDIVGTYSANEPPAVFNAQLRRRLGLPGNDPELMRLILNKLRLRRRLCAEGLSRLAVADGASVLGSERWPFARPVYFKPTHGHASLCVRRCTSRADLLQAVEQWRAVVDTEPGAERHDAYITREKGFFLEEEHAGELLSVEAIVFGADVRVLGILGRHLYSRDRTIELGSIFPYPHPHASRILERARSIIARLGYRHGPVHMEMIVADDGEVELVDFNPRFAGADVLLSMNQAYGVEVERLVVASSLGLCPPPEPLEVKRYCSTRSFFLPREVDIFEGIEFPDDERITFKTCRVEKGSPAKHGRTERDVAGSYLVVGASPEEAIERSRRLRDGVRVNGRHSVEF
ncbi:ATP-grasp domain-containing protein [Sorangium sp. So ce134]